MSSRITLLICALGVLLLTNGCNLYEDNFTAEGQLYKNVNGTYGLDENCIYVSEGDNPPEGKSAPVFTLLFTYRIKGRSCGIDTVTKDGNGFILTPMLCTSDHKRISGSKSTFKYIEPFQIRVERIGAHKITVKEKNKPTLTLVECGEN